MRAGLLPFLKSTYTLLSLGGVRGAYSAAAWRAGAREQAWPSSKATAIRCCPVFVQCEILPELLDAMPSSCWHKQCVVLTWRRAGAAGCYALALACGASAQQQQCARGRWDSADAHLRHCAAVVAAISTRGRRRRMVRAPNSCITMRLVREAPLDNFQGQAGKAWACTHYNHASGIIRHLWRAGQFCQLLLLAMGRDRGVIHF